MRLAVAMLLLAVELGGCDCILPYRAHLVDLTIDASSPDLTADRRAGDLPRPCALGAYRKQVRLFASKVGAPSLIDFPALISLARDAELAARARDDGHDLVFAGSDGALLDHELELFDGQTGRLVAWVKIPALGSTADTLLWLYYGGSGRSASWENPAGVWSSGYRGVWHLDGLPGGVVRDSTSFAHHGQPQAALAESHFLEGRVGKGVDLYGGTHWVSIPDRSTLSVTGAFTVETWYRPGIIKTMVDEGQLVAKHGLSGFRGWDLGLYAYDEEIAAGTACVQLRLSPSPTGAMKYVSDWKGLPTGQWHHAAGVFSPSVSAKLYIDGVEVAALDPPVPGSMNSPALPVTLSRRQDTSSTPYFPVMLDEVRISAASRSPGWIATQFANQSSPSSFHGLGSEEAVPPCDQLDRAVLVDARSPDTRRGDVAVKPDFASDVFRWPDVSAPDAPKVDLRPLDALGPPDQTLAGCASGTTKAVDSKMVFCTTATFLSQCSAHTLCNAAAGWQLCTSSQYLLRYKTKAPPVTDAWIAGCVRDGGAPQSPTEAVCSQCTLKKNATLEYSFSCSGSSSSGSEVVYVGVTSDGSCYAAGVNTPATQGFWIPTMAALTVPSAACCLP